MVGKIGGKISIPTHTLTHLPLPVIRQHQRKTPVYRSTAQHRRYIALSTSGSDNTDEGEGGATPFMFAYADAYPSHTPISNIDNISNTLC